MISPSPPSPEAGEGQAGGLKPHARDGGFRGARTDLLFGVALFLVALIPRLWVALALRGEAVWDGHYYDFGARRIAAGFDYSDDIEVWHP